MPTQNGRFSHLRPSRNVVGGRWRYIRGARYFQTRGAASPQSVETSFRTADLPKACHRRSSARGKVESALIVIRDRDACDLRRVRSIDFEDRWNRWRYPLVSDSSSSSFFSSTATRETELAGDFDARRGDNRWIEGDREDIATDIVPRCSRLVVVRDLSPGRGIGVDPGPDSGGPDESSEREREQEREGDMPGSHGTSHQDRSRTKRGL